MASPTPWPQNTTPGIRNSERLAKDMIAVRLSGEHHSAGVAAPSYLEERLSLEVPENLHLHRCIAYRLDDPNIAARAARQAVGLCYLFRESVADQLKTGALVEVLRDWSVPVAGDFLYHSDRRTLSAAMRVVIDRLRLRHPSSSVRGCLSKQVPAFARQGSRYSL